MESSIFVTREGSEGSPFTRTMYLPDADFNSTNILAELGLDKWYVTKNPNFGEDGGVIKNSHYLQKTYRNLGDGEDSILAPYVSDRYEIIQFEEAFNWADVFIREKLLQMDSVLLLGDKTLAINNNILTMEDEEVIADDVIKPYLLITLGHQKHSKRAICFTAIRAVCENTLNSALAIAAKDANSKFSLVGSGSLNNAMGCISLAKRKFQEEMNFYKTLVGKTISRREVSECFKIIAAIDEIDPDSEPKKYKAASSLIDRLELAYQSSPGMGSLLDTNTAWRVFNAATYVADHTSVHASTSWVNRHSGSGRTLRVKARELVKVI